MTEPAQLLLVHTDGRREVLLDLFPGVTEFGRDRQGKPITRPPLWVYDPWRVAPRPREPVLLERANSADPVGRFILYDVTRGRNMAGVRRNEIRKLLVLEQPPMPAHTGGTRACMSNGGTYSFARSFAALTRREPRGKYEQGPLLYTAFSTNAAGNPSPRALGAAASRLMKYLEPAHYDVRLAPIDRDRVRLWIENGCTSYRNYSEYENWAGEMKRNGVEVVKQSDGKVDPWATEQRYWESHGLKPMPKEESS